MAALRRRRRRPHGPRHRHRLRLCRPPHRAGRPAPAQRPRPGSSCATRRAPRSAPASRAGPARRGRRRHRSTPIAARVELVDAGGAPAALAAAELVFEGVPETLEAKREAFEQINRHCRDDAILTSTTSSILVTQLAAAGAPAGALPQHALAQPGLRDPGGRAELPRRHRPGGAGAHQGADGGDRQAAGGLRRHARLHRAAAAGAGDERGGAHDRGGRRHRRGDRQGHALRPGAALRGARRGRVHRLRRLRHPASREPRDVGLDRPRTLHRAGHRRPDGRRRAGWG